MSANSFYLIGQKPLIGRDFTSGMHATAQPLVLLRLRPLDRLSKLFMRWRGSNPLIISCGIALLVKS